MATIPVKGREYTGYAYLAAEGGVGPVTISLAWGSAGSEMDVDTFKRIRSKYRKVTFKFTVGADTDNGRFTISVSGRGTLKIGFSIPADVDACESPACDRCTSNRDSAGRTELA